MTDVLQQDRPKTAPLTIDVLLANAAAAHGNRVALLDTQADGADREITYAALVTDTQTRARWILEQLTPAGTRRPRIGLVLPNGSDLALNLLAVTLVGEAAPLNPKLTQSEFAGDYVLLGLDAVVLSDRSPKAAYDAAMAADLTVLRLDQAADISGTKTLSAPDPDDIALVLMTSGSTGKAKVVPLSHRNVCVSSADVARSIMLTEQDRALVMWEQFHIGGLVDLLLAPLSVGGSVAVTGGFNATHFFELLPEVCPTWFQAVPTTLGELLRHGTVVGFDGPSSLRLVRSVAAALTPELQAKIEDMFGVPVVRTLGMTEAGPLITSTGLPPAPQKAGSVGRPAGPRVQVIGDDGVALPQGVAGEVVVQGDNVFKGYEAGADNATAFANGWFRTGDVGYFDADGDLFLTGRIKDMINRGGEKISPAEVDAALLAARGVHEAGSFSVSHATLGEDISAAIVADADVDLDALRRSLADRLTAHKIPSRIHRLDALPKTPVGKIDRPALAKMFAEKASASNSAEPPKPGMEAFLAGIWGEELGKPVRDRNLDFAALDGDSLSAVRVVAATEDALGVVLPDAVFEHLTNVVEMSDYLLAEGFTAPSQASFSDEATSARSVEVALKYPTGLEDDFLAQVRKRLAGCTSPNALSAMLHNLETFTTHEDLQHVADALASVVPGSAAGGVSFLKGLLLRRDMRRSWRDWRQKIAEERSGAHWQKTQIAPAALMYRADTVGAADKTLIVAFTGVASRIALPVRWVLAALDPVRYDIAIVADTDRTLFEEGSRGLGADPLALVQSVAALTEIAPYDRVVALGNSGGAPAAIIAALVNGWQRGVAIVPARLSDHPKLERQLADASTEYGPQSPKTEIIGVRGTRDKEVEALGEIMTHVARMRVHEEPIDAKDILFRAHKAGTLKDLLDRLLG